MLFFPFRLKYAYFKPVTATVALGLLTGIVFLLQVGRAADFDRWGLMAGQGQPERLLTHVFFHGRLTHFLVNITFFFVFAQVVNAAVGTRTFLLVFVVCALSSAAAELALDDRLREVPSIGLSGVIAGLVLISSLWIPRVKVTFFVWIILMFGFVDFRIWAVAGTWLIADSFTVALADWRNLTTAYWGHLGGFVGGLACFLILRGFKAAELRGFLVRPESSRARLRLGRLLREQRDGASAEGDAGAPLAATCLRCGFRMLLREPPGEKGLKCTTCGQASRDCIPGHSPRGGNRRLCDLALAGAAMALGVAGALLMRA